MEFSNEKSIFNVFENAIFIGAIFIPSFENGELSKLSLHCAFNCRNVPGGRIE